MVKGGFVCWVESCIEVSHYDGMCGGVCVVVVRDVVVDGFSDVVPFIIWGAVHPYDIQGSGVVLFQGDVTEVSV